MRAPTHAPSSMSPSLPLGIPDPSIERDRVAPATLTVDERSAVRQWTFIVPFAIGVLFFVLGVATTGALVWVTRAPPLDPARENERVKVAALDHLLALSPAYDDAVVCVDVDHDDARADRVIAARTSPVRVVHRRSCAHAARSLGRPTRLLFVGDVRFVGERRAVVWASGLGRSKLTFALVDGAWSLLDEKHH